MSIFIKVDIFFEGVKESNESIENSALKFIGCLALEYRGLPLYETYRYLKLFVFSCRITFDRKFSMLPGSTGEYEKFLIIQEEIKMIKLIAGIFILLFMFAPVKGVETRMNTNNNQQIEKNLLLAKDREIAAVSAKQGVLQAIYPFMMEKSLLFPIKGHPIFGRDNCVRLMKQEEIKNGAVKLTWEPLFADVSAACDLGYTYGRFEIPAAGAAGDKKNDVVYYSMIWQKDAVGNWLVAVCQRLILLENLKQKPLDLKLDLSKLDDKTREVAAVEHTFAQYAKEKGIIEAFYRFIADAGIALSQNGPPRTKETYSKLLAVSHEQNKTGVGESTLEWEPVFSHVSVSGDMAYNFGPYKYTASAADGSVQVGYGYFLTVWKKQPDNTWKFVLDGGSQY